MRILIFAILITVCYIQLGEASMETSIRALGNAGGVRSDYNKKRSADEASEINDTIATDNYIHSKQGHSTNTNEETEDMHIVLGNKMAVNTGYAMNPWPNTAPAYYPYNYPNYPAPYPIAYYQNPYSPYNQVAYNPVVYY